MAQIQANGISLEYEMFGSPSRPVLLLVSRLAGQLLDWDEAICRSIAEQGFCVVRFDNRDSGLSSHMADPHSGAAADMFRAVMKGEPVTPLYTLQDMARDALGLLEALEVERAHVCGISMGGIIAQTMAILAPQRLKSLISVYSTTGNPGLPPPRPEALKVLFEPAPVKRPAYIAHAVKMFRVISGNGIPFDEEAHRALAGRYFDRSFSPQGTAHQLIAVMLQPDRREALAALKLPVLVIHGDDDPLVQVAAGKETAEVIPGAELLIVEGMGHDIPMMNPHWKKIRAALVAHMKKVEAGGWA